MLVQVIKSYQYKYGKQSSKTFMIKLSAVKGHSKHNTCVLSFKYGEDQAIEQTSIETIASEIIISGWSLYAKKNRVKKKCRVRRLGSSTIMVY